ncbi:MAG: helix-turn-helix transcriptional regulator [Bacteroidetes bacterium]|nr:helix-turn-helix transcriptional regulator [Bacteroidota bacterium]
MGVHIGEKIRQRAKELRMGPTELGKLVHTSKQNIAGIYKRKSIDAELLRKLSHALNYNFFEYYSPSVVITYANEEQAAHRKSSGTKYGKKKNSKKKNNLDLATELHAIRQLLDVIFKKLENPLQ